MKTVTVTGSHGFIGSALRVKLECEHYPYDTKIGKDVAMPRPQLGMSPYDYTAIEQDIQESDVVFHLSCLTQEAAEADPHQNWWNNVEDTRRIAQLCGKYGKRLVFTSSASVYGNQSGALYEHSPTLPTSNYAIAKLAAEHFVRKHAPNHVILRLSNVYGPGQTPENPYCGFIGKVFSAVMNDQPVTIYGDGQQTRDFTYIDDVVEALLYFAEKGTSIQTTLNISTGEATKIAAVHYKIMKLFGSEGKPFFEAREPRSIDNIQRRLLDNTSAWAMGWMPETSLAEGLRRTYDWWNERSL